MSKAKADFTAYERVFTKHTEDLKHFASKEKSLRATGKAEEKKANELKAAIAKLQDDILSSEKQIAECTKALQKEEGKLEEIMESLKDLTGDMHVQLAQKQQELSPFSRKQAETQSRVDVLRSELKMVQSGSTEAQKQLEEAEAKLTEVQSALESASQEITEKTARLASDEKQLASLKAELEALLVEERQVNGELNKLRGSLEESKSVAQAFSSQSKLLQSLMKLKKSGRLNGIHGRLGDLGTIPAEYDIAISTACAALDNIVVDTPETGEACVEFLRTHSLGRATFIILSKLGHLEEAMNHPPETPNQTPRLFDLVNIKDRVYRPAFYYALRDTLVGENIDEATKIAFQGTRRWRVVTKSGELIDNTGTMSGGGTKVQKGGMAARETAQVDAKEIASIESKVGELSKRLEALKTRKAQLELDIQLIGRNIPETQTSLKKLRLNVKELPSQISDLEKSIPLLKQQTVLNAAQKSKSKELEAQIAASEAEIQDIDAKSASIQEAIKDLEAQIAGAGGVKLKLQKSKVDALTEKIDVLNTEITKAKVQIETKDKNLSKAEAAVKKAGESLAQVDVERQAAVAEFQKAEETASKVKESYKATKTILEEKADLLKKLVKKHDKLQKDTQAQRTAELELQNELDELNTKVAELDNGQAKFAKDLATLASKLDALKVDEELQIEPLPELDEDELRQINLKNLIREIAVLEDATHKMKPNMTVLAEYRKKDAEYNTRVAEFDRLSEERNEKRNVYDSLRKRRLEEFMAAFHIITMKLKEMYQMITLGGDAELELVDTLDPFSEGIVFSVRPPKKSWKNIVNLSGGEKTLSSLALVFALHHYKPTPLYIMDEIDAALDFKNVSIVANYIKERTSNAQFIIISLRNYMFELADRLVGIYKTQDCTKSVTINPNNFALHVAQ